MSNIRELKPRPAQINEQTVAMLREWLAEAEKGELVSIAMAAVLKDGSSFTGATESDNCQMLLGALAILQHRMLVNRNTD